MCIVADKQLSEWIRGGTISRSVKLDLFFMVKMLCILLSVLVYA